MDSRDRPGQTIQPTARSVGRDRVDRARMAGMADMPVLQSRPQDNRERAARSAGQDLWDTTGTEDRADRAQKAAPRRRARPLRGQRAHQASRLAPDRDWWDRPSCFSRVGSPTLPAPRSSLPDAQTTHANSDDSGHSCESRVRWRAVAARNHRSPGATVVSDLPAHSVAAVEMSLL